MPRVPRRAPTPKASRAIHPSVPVVGAAFGDDWWRRGVIYQVYPRSFADSDNDGVKELTLSYTMFPAPDAKGPKG